MKKQTDFIKCLFFKVQIIYFTVTLRIEREKENFLLPSLTQENKKFLKKIYSFYNVSF